jgi:5'-3' exonuclease
MGMTAAPRLVLVDGTGSAYRAFYALPPLTSPSGVPTNAVLGFASMLLKLLREEAPEAVAVAFDGPGPTTRHREYADYKANRPETPEAFIRQMPYILELLEGLRIPALLMTGEEADDILGSMARRAVAGGYAVTLVTGDKDLLQLVDARVTVRDPVKGMRTGPAEVREKYGVAPPGVPDFLALMGDSVDNIPGVPGIGAKTARELLERFGTLEAVLARAAEIPRPKLREALRVHAEQARLSRRLAVIRTDLAVPWTPDDLARREPDVRRVLTLCRELQLTRLAALFAQPGLEEAAP